MFCEWCVCDMYVFFVKLSVVRVLFKELICEIFVGCNFYFSFLICVCLIVVEMKDNVYSFEVEDNDRKLCIMIFF